MSTKKKRGPGRPSRYAPEFQRDAVTMVLDEKRPIADVARVTDRRRACLGAHVVVPRRARRGVRRMRADRARGHRGQALQQPVPARDPLRRLGEGEVTDMAEASRVPAARAHSLPRGLSGASLRNRRRHPLGRGTFQRMFSDQWRPLTFGLAGALAISVALAIIGGRLGERLRREAGERVAGGCPIAC